MSTSFRGNWMDKLASFVPGYKGYKEQPVRRYTDQLLRASVTKRLSDGRMPIDHAISDFMSRQQPALVSKVNAIKRSVEGLIEQLKTAPPSYKGLFEAFTLETTLLYRLYRYDLALRDRTEEVAILIGGIAMAKDVSDLCDQITTGLQLVTEAIRARDQAIAEIK